MQYRQVQSIGGTFLSTLTGLWAAGDDHLYAAGDSLVAVFDRAGALRRKWATARPVLSVAVRGDGAVLAGESGQVEVFDRNGKPAGVLRDPELGEVTAMGFVGRNLLAADSRDRSIRCYDAAGKLLHKIGKDNRTNGFLIPNGALDFTVDASGIIHAANPGKHRVEQYKADGELLGHFGHFDGNDPTGYPGCCNPTNVTAGADGRFYVTEKAGPRAKALDHDGKLLGVIATDVFHAMSKNMSIAADTRGRVYVADTGRLTVLAFEAADTEGAHHE